MAFGRKKSGQDSAPKTVQNVSSQAAPKKGAKPAKKKRAQRDLLSSIINESVPGTAAAILRENAPFIVPLGAVNGKELTGYATLLVHTSDENFGGLSQKLSSHDQQKGAVVELINGDQIQVVATEKLLADDEFAIIPTGESLDRADEFSLLSDYPYTWCIFIALPDGVYPHDLPTEFAERTVTLADAYKVARGDISLAEAMGADMWAAVTAESGASETTVADLPTTPRDVEEPTEAVPDEAQMPVNGSVQNPAPFGGESAAPAVPVSAAQTAQTPPADVDDDGTADYGSLDETADTYADSEDSEGVDDIDTGAFAPVSAVRNAQPTGTAQTAEIARADESAEPVQHRATYVSEQDEAAQTVHDDREIGIEAVRDRVVREFLDDDVTIPVTLDRYFASYPDEEPLVLFPRIENVTTWLEENVAQLVERANIDIQRHHADNREKEKELFAKLMSRGIEDVLATNDLSNPDTLFGKFSLQLSDRRAQAMKDMGMTISQRQEQEQQKYEKLKEAFVEEAVADARRVFQQQYGAELDQIKSEMPEIVRREIESISQTDEAQMLAERRTKVSEAVSLVEARVLQALSEFRTTHRAEESALVQEWNETLQKFIDDNRKHDIARAEALAEEMSRSNLVKEKEEEFRQQRKRDEESYAREIAQLEKTLSGRNEELRADIERLRAEHEANLAKAAKALDDERKLTDEVRGQMKEVEGIVHKQYQERIETLEQSRRIAQEDATRAKEDSKKSMTTFSIYVALICLIVLVCGLIAGMFVGSLVSHQAADVVTHVSALAGSSVPLL